MSNADSVWRILTMFFLGCIFVAVITHANQFATFSGTLFKGVNRFGYALENGSLEQG